MNYDKKYHFYIDEGGLFGNALICISSKKVKSNKDDIDFYYFDKLRLDSILRYINLFKTAYPECHIAHHPKSEIEVTESLLEEWDDECNGIG